MDIKKIIKGEFDRRNVVVKGWVKSSQLHSNVTFFQINDGSTFNNLQVILKKPIPHTIPVGSAVEVTGVLQNSQGSQEWELLATNITTLSRAEDFPIQKKEHSSEFLREIAHLRQRTKVFAAVSKVKNELSYAIHKFFHDKGFFWFQGPILTSNSCEGGAEVFEIEGSNKYFKQKTLLTVSAQFHAEAQALGLGKVYTFGPTFRAEKSNTSHHLSEFWMVEAEVAFSTLDQILEIIESFIKFSIRWVVKECEEELSILTEMIEDNEKLLEKLKAIAKSSFKRLDYEDAIRFLTEAGFRISLGEDLTSEHERYITNKFTNRPVFVVNYPRKIRAFYMKDIDNSDRVKSTDLLVPGIGELVGGSEREGDFKKLEEKSKEFGVDLNNISWYLGLRNYGYYTSSGFGCGFERLLMLVTGVKNIKDAISFPRSHGQLSF